MKFSSLNVGPLTEAEVRAIVAWQYEPPYDFYNTRTGEEVTAVAALLDPANQCYGLREQDGTLSGFMSLGADARVPGGSYVDDATDIGIGIRPDLTGRGQGRRFLAAVIRFARASQSAAIPLRVTIAEFNERAQRLVRGAGFEEIERFRHEHDRTEFVVLLLQPD